MNREISVEYRDSNCGVRLLGEKRRPFQVPLIVAICILLLGISVASLYFHFGKLPLLQPNGPSSGRAIQGKVDWSATEADIAEAVFRYQLTHYRLRDWPQRYFLALGSDTDPNDDFMKRFSHEAVPVGKFSQSVYEDSEVRDKETRERGMVLEVSSIEMTNHNAARVRGLWFSAKDSGGRFLYHVVLEGNDWVVKTSESIYDI